VLAYIIFFGKTPSIIKSHWVRPAQYGQHNFIKRESQIIKRQIFEKNVEQIENKLHKSQQQT